MAFILGIVFGVLFTFIGIGIYGLFSTKDKVEKDKNIAKTYIRRGIWENDYTSQNSNSVYGDLIKETFTVQFELGEVESTGSKSKVEVISMNCRKSQFNTEATFTKIKGMVNGTWMLSSEIEWIDDRAKERNSKIDGILN